MYDKLANMKKLFVSIKEMDSQIKAEQRKATSYEKETMLRWYDLVKRIKNGEEIDLSKPQNEPTKPDPNCGSESDYRSKHSMRKNETPFTLKGPDDKKDYRSLFGDGLNYKWQDRRTGYWQAAGSGQHHPDLETRTMIEGVGSDGGFWVPDEWAGKIHEVSLEDEIVMPRAYVQPMKFDEYHLPAYTIGDHSSNLMGGFIAYYKGETSALTEANPKAREIHLKTKKLTGLIRMSRELLDDKLQGGRGLTDTMGAGISWARDKFFLKGSGAGEPLGILNANCLITQPKEAAQSADTILYSNLSGMMSKLFPGSFNRAVWICHVSCVDQLLQLSIPVGTGGSAYPAMNENNGKFTLLSRPVIFTEKTEPVGKKGSVILADLSQYVIGLRFGMRFAMDESRYFESDEVVGKVIERHDGQPLWDEALTLEDGATEVSPFITLAERA